jgi:predicted GH43/DUF377 family glycosyl hydrolase
VKHNVETATKWLKEKGIVDTHKAVTHQVESYPLNITTLSAFAYNPSISRANGKLWMTYRFHVMGSIATKLGIAEIEPHGNVTRSATLDIAGHSVEDAKFFSWKGQRWLSWVESDFAGQAKPKCVVKIGRLTDDWKVTDIEQPNFRKNDWSGMEKNWVWFESDQKLYAVYTTTGTHEVLEIHNDTHHESEGVRWAWGDFKGDIIVGEHEGKLLRFFHSTLDADDPPDIRRYYVGALLMDPKPPFRISKVSREPLLAGSIADDFVPQQREKIHHHKAKVVFPGGAIKLQDSWLLSVGVNDSACKLVKITDLKL